MNSPDTWGREDDRLFNLAARGLRDPTADKATLDALGAMGEPHPHDLLARWETLRFVGQFLVAEATPRVYFSEDGTAAMHYAPGYERLTSPDGETDVIEPGGLQWHEMDLDGRLYDGPLDQAGYYPGSPSQ